MSDNKLSVAEPDSFPKAILMLQKLNRTEKTRLLKVISSPAFGFSPDLEEFYVEIRKKCRSDFNHNSLTLGALKKAFEENDKRKKNWLNYILADLVTAIDTTLNLEFQKENTALTAYIKAVNHLNFKEPDLYDQALDDLEEELKDTSAFDSLTPYLNFQLELMRDADLQKSVQRKQHTAYQNAFTALDKFYLTQQLVLGIELSNRRNVMNQSADLERLKDTLSQPLFNALLADKNIFLLSSLFQLFNTDIRDKGFSTAVERLWMEVKNEIKPANYMLCHYMSLLLIRCINIGHTHFRHYYLALKVAMFKAEMFDRKGAITSGNLKNLVKIAIDDNNVALAEKMFDNLKIYVADDLNGFAEKLIKAMIHKAKGELAEMYQLLADVHQKVPLYEKLTLFRMQIEAEFEADIDASTIAGADKTNTIDNLQKFIKRHEGDLPPDKLEAHKNFVDAVKALRKDYGEKESMVKLYEWVNTCGNIAGRTWLLTQLQKK